MNEWTDGWKKERKKERTNIETMNFKKNELIWWMNYGKKISKMNDM